MAWMRQAFSIAELTFRRFQIMRASVNGRAQSVSSYRMQFYQRKMTMRKTNIVGFLQHRYPRKLCQLNLQDEALK